LRKAESSVRSSGNIRHPRNCALHAIIGDIKQRFRKRRKELIVPQTGGDSPTYSSADLLIHSPHFTFIVLLRSGADEVKEDGGKRTEFAKVSRRRIGGS
jgi:hypothetical protein